MDKTTDYVFAKKIKAIKDFEFNEEVVSVFDDMVSRSVPFYSEIHRIIKDLSNYFLPKENGLVYDIGCSTGTTIQILAEYLTKNKKNCHFIGVDNSEAMAKKCQEKLLKSDIQNAQIFCQKIETFSFERPAHMIIMNYTLQFIDPEVRLNILKKVYDNLQPGGIFILSEKINTEESSFHNLITDLYYDFKKRNGYSDLEISQKREALENVLLPLTPKNQVNMLKDAGFKKSELIFRWYNFASYIGIK